MFIVPLVLMQLRHCHLFHLASISQVDFQIFVNYLPGQFKMPLGIISSVLHDVNTAAIVTVYRICLGIQITA